MKVLVGLKELEALFSLKERDPSILSGVDGILKELREMKLRVSGAVKVFSAVPGAIEDINQALLLFTRAKDFAETVAQRRKRAGGQG
ncbi:MAG: hypothetical protein HYY78_12280 [Betaproteobacteria bacterium]|nr:hypothetical protein [Betaproteobacteria bacterium]